MEEKDVAEDGSLKSVKYAQSPVMSTYLVAFVVGEFDFVEGKDSDGINIRVYTPKGKAVQGQFALEVSAGCSVQTNYEFRVVISRWDPGTSTKIHKSQ